MLQTRTLTLAGSAIAAAAGLLLGLQLIPAPEKVPDGATAPLGSASSVAILVVHDKNMLREVRDAIDGERVVAEGEYAFALEEGRIVALESAYAGPLIGALGWTDRTIELIDAANLGGRDPRRPKSRSNSNGAANAHAAAARRDLNRLSKKKTLSLGEAIRVLNASP